MMEKRKTKVEKQWVVAIAATVLLGWTLRRTDISTWQNMSAAEVLPVLGISLVIFAIKAGVLSGAVLLVRKLWKAITAHKK